MNSLPDMLWVETRKAIRSRMPLWTALGSLFMPLGLAFLLFVARNPAISQNLGLASAKANLMAYAATDWPTYVGACAQVIGIGEFFVLVLATSWVFGREFVDGTLKDLLAVPVPRASILLAKFVLVAIWSVLLTLVISIASLCLGALLKLAGGSSSVVLHGSGVMALTACLVIGVVLPFAFLASIGRGYLLPIGAAVLLVMAANLSFLLGWGAYFPWGVPMLYAQGKSALPMASYWIVVLTGLVGMMVTYLWWKYADQNR